MSEELQVEATGETVGEAKWQALRELERKRPGLDKSRVRFQVVSEGERGLLGVGYTPARVVAHVEGDELAASAEPDAAESDLARALRDVLERVAEALGARSRVRISEDDETLRATFVEGDLGLLIGKHGQTIDAIQHVAQAVLARADRDHGRSVLVDAGGYRARRESIVEALALRSAREALRTGDVVELEPMTAAERKIVHLRLSEVEGVETSSEGNEPNRYVVIRRRAGE